MKPQDPSSLKREIEDFFSQFPLREYAKGHVIVEAGDEPPGVMYINEGVIGQFDIARNGSKVGVNSFKAGAFCPMSWAINQTPNRYYYEAVSDLSVRVAPRGTTVEWLKHNPHILFDLLSRVYRGLDGLLEQHTILLSSNARARVLFSIILQAKRYGTTADEGVTRVDITETYLAQQAGVARETVSRQLRALKNCGWIDVNRGEIHIFDLKKLESELAKEH